MFSVDQYKDKTGSKEVTHTLKSIGYFLMLQHKMGVCSVTAAKDHFLGFILIGSRVE